MIYSPVAGFVLGSGKFIFPLFLLAGVIGFLKDAYKQVAMKAIFVAAACTCIAWWSFISSC